MAPKGPFFFFFSSDAPRARCIEAVPNRSTCLIDNAFGAGLHPDKSMPRNRCGSCTDSRTLVETGSELTPTAVSFVCNTSVAYFGSVPTARRYDWLPCSWHGIPAKDGSLCRAKILCRVANAWPLKQRCPSSPNTILASLLPSHPRPQRFSPHDTAFCQMVLGFSS